MGRREKHTGIRENSFGQKLNRSGQGLNYLGKREKIRASSPNFCKKLIWHFCGKIDLLCNCGTTQLGFVVFLENLSHLIYEMNY